MSDRAEMRGPVTRRRRTTISGGGAASVKQANGSKWHEAAEKPPLCPVKVKPEEVSRQANNNDKVDREKEMPRQQQLTHSSRKESGTVEDINDRLR